MMIRLADLDDIPGLMAISKPCYDQMSFDDYGWKYEPERIEESYRRGVQSDNHLLIVTEEDSEIIGLLFINISIESYYFKNNPYANEIMWHVTPLASQFKRSKYMLKMLDYAEKLLAGMGIKNLYVGADSRTEFSGIANNLVNKRGYQSISLRLYKEIKP